MQVLPIPTALPVARRDNEDAVFKNQDGKMKALLKNVLTVHSKVVGNLHPSSPLIKCLSALLRIASQPISIHVPLTYVRTTHHTPLPFVGPADPHRHHQRRDQ